MDGIASNLATLMPALQRQGWEPHFAVGWIDCPIGYESRLADIRRAAVTFHEHPLLACRNGITPWIVVRQAQLLRDLCRELGIRVIHLRGRALGPAATLCRFGGGPGVVNVPPLAPTHRMRSRFGFTRVQGRLLGDRVIAISGEMIEHLEKVWGVPSARIRHVPHGISLDRFAPPSQYEAQIERHRLSLPENAFVISQIARVGQIKRPDTVVRAVARLANDGMDVVGIFAGHCEPSERQTLETLGKRLEVEDRIRILGHVDTRTVLWASNASVLASEREGFAIAVIEAMACGLPTIRTPTEGASDQIIDGENGLLFPVGDDAALAECLRRVITDLQLRESLGSAALSTAIQKFSDEAMARGTVKVYQELC